MQIVKEEKESIPLLWIGCGKEVNRLIWNRKYPWKISCTQRPDEVKGAGYIYFEEGIFWQWEHWRAEIKNWDHDIKVAKSWNEEVAKPTVGEDIRQVIGD